MPSDALTCPRAVWFFFFSDGWTVVESRQDNQERKRTMTTEQIFLLFIAPYMEFNNLKKERKKRLAAGSPETAKGCQAC